CRCLRANLETLTQPHSVRQRLSRRDDPALATLCWLSRHMDSAIPMLYSNARQAFLFSREPSHRLKVSTSPIALACAESHPLSMIETVGLPHLNNLDKCSEGPHPISPQSSKRRRRRAAGRWRPASAPAGPA